MVCWMVMCAKEKNKTWKSLGDCQGYGVVAVLSKLINGGYCVELLYGYIITLFAEQVVAEKSAFQFMRHLSFIRITRGVGIAVPILQMRMLRLKEKNLTLKSGL